MMAAGPGDSNVMESLLDARWSVTRALAAAVASRCPPGHGDLGQAARDGWALISELDTERRDVVQEILTYPLVQAWLLRCLGVEQVADSDLDRAHVAGLAVAAALRAGIEVEVLVPVRDGAVHLPAIGTLTVDTHDRTVAVRVSPAGLGASPGQRAWHTVRRVAAHGLSVTVDDGDPFRDCQGWAVAGRLSAAAWRDWRLALPDAARQLAVALPAYASVIGAGLRTVIPLRPDPAGDARSGTARAAFGALALALPPDVSTLSTLLLHEMQHVKLTALCDLLDLFDHADSTLFRVGWRPDPRPTEAALHGAYAYMAIAEWWRFRAQSAADGEAQRRFLMIRGWVSDAADALLAAGTLTPEGERFVSGMGATVEGWADAR